MPYVGLAEVTKGAVLNADVYSPLGGLVMQKGTVVTEREFEILSAFMIKSVDIENGTNKGDKLTSSWLMTEMKPNPASAEQPAKEEGTGSVLTSPAQENTANLESVKRSHVKLGISSHFEQHFTRAVRYYRKMFESLWIGLSLQELREIMQPLIPYAMDPSHILYTMKQAYPMHEFTYYHSVAVGFVSLSIARWSQIPSSEWLDVGVAGMLHDMGKYKIHPQVLYRTEGLTDREFQEVRKYPVYGYQLMKGVSGVPDGILFGILQHQEREDGSGYPLRLRSSSIHPYAKIIAIADIFHAMSSNKSYRSGVSPFLVLEQLLQDSFGKLDPSLVRTFVNGMTKFSIGTQVELSDGSKGRIIFTDVSNPTRPMVEVQGQILNLAVNRQLVIKQVFV